MRRGRPVVGAPVPGESRVTHVEMVEYAARDEFEEGEPLAGAVLSMVLHDSEHPDGASLQQTLTKISHLITIETDRLGELLKLLQGTTV